MKLPIASLHKEIFISILYGGVNISCCGSLPGITSDVLLFFSMSRSHLFNMIAGERIMLNFLRSPKTPAFRKNCIVGFISAEKTHFG